MEELKKKESSVDEMFTDLFGAALFGTTEQQETVLMKLKRRVVPEDREAEFTAVIPTGSGGYSAVCKKCGAVVYATALDRHVAFHEQEEAARKLVVKLAGLKEEGA